MSSESENQHEYWFDRIFLCQTCDDYRVEFNRIKKVRMGRRVYAISLAYCMTTVRNVKGMMPEPDV